MWEKRCLKTKEANAKRTVLGLLKCREVNVDASIVQIEGVKIYIHYIVSGHVVWMCRLYGKLWRYWNEGVEAFNKIVPLHHKRHHGNGGTQRARECAATEHDLNT
jgi:hypothetical protein